MLAGGAVKGGRIVADWPGLAPAQLYQARDIRPTADLRALFVGVTSDHFRLDPALVVRTVFAGDTVKPMTGLVRS